MEHPNSAPVLTALSPDLIAIMTTEHYNTMAAMIAVINSVLIGSFVGLLLAALDMALWAGAGAGVVAFLMSEGLHHRHQWVQWLGAMRTIPAPPQGTKV